MKNKNLIVMAVAIGSGLVAAFLVAKLGANSAAPKQDLVEVLVAKRDISIGTLLDEKDFPELLAIAQLPRVAVPADVVLDPALLKGKRASKTMKANQYFTPLDISTKTGVTLPKGMESFSIRMDAVRAVTGFVFPGDRVDILSMLPTKKDPNKKTSARILVNMLVTAVDIQDRRPEGGGTANPTIQAVTLAVTPSQAKLLHTAEAGGGDMRLVLRPENYEPQDGDEADPVFSIDDDHKPVNAPMPPSVPMDKIVYAKKDVPLNTQLTEKNVEEFFELKAHPAPVPAKAVKDLAALKDKYVVVPQFAEFALTDNALSDKELPPDTKIVEKIVEKVVEVKVAEERKPEPKKPLVQHTLTVVGPSGSRSEYTYEGKDKSGLKQVDQPTRSDEKIEVKPLEPNAAPAPEAEEKPVVGGQRPI